MRHDQKFNHLTDTPKMVPHTPVTARKISTVPTHANGLYVQPRPTSHDFDPIFSIYGGTKRGTIEPLKLPKFERTNYHKKEPTMTLMLDELGNHPRQKEIAKESVDSLDPIVPDILDYIMRTTPRHLWTDLSMTTLSILASLVASKRITIIKKASTE